MTELVWKQSTGECFRDGVWWFLGYAGGNCGKNPDAVNNPAMQHLPNVGPLPRGKYRLVRFVTAQFPEPGRVFDPTEFGPAYIRLEPLDESVMMGRGGFLIHYDRVDAKLHPQSGSMGCPCPYNGIYVAEFAQYIGEILEVVE